MHENLFQILGVAGFIVYILSYLFLQLGRVDGRGVIYPLLNFAAASLVLLSLLDQFNLASALIQTSWIIISLFGMTRGMIRANPPVRTEIRSFSR